MLVKECKRCGKFIPYGLTYCEQCKPVVDAEKETILKERRRLSNRKYNQTRDPKYVRFYNSIEWRTLSRRYAMDKGYKCECCKSIATEVHHIKAIQTPEGWERRLDYTNLKLLCTKCHNKAHDRFTKKKYYREP